MMRKTFLHMHARKLALVALRELWSGANFLKILWNPLPKLCCQVPGM